NVEWRIRRNSRETSGSSLVIALAGFCHFQAHAHFNEIFVTVSQDNLCTWNTPHEPLEASVNNFSIFEQALQISPPELTENLGQLVLISRRDFSDRESFLCRSTTASLEYACLMIENGLLLRTNRNGRV